MNVIAAIQFRKMQKRDRRQVRALLGAHVYQNTNTTSLVACIPGSPVIIGAAAILNTPISSRPKSAPFTLTIAQPFRRQGIAQRFIRAAGAFSSHELQIPALCNWYGVQRGSPESEIWQQLGFETRTKLAHYNADLRPYIDLMTLNASRLRARNRIPGNAVVIPLADAPHGPIIDLHLRYIGGSRARLERRLQGQDTHPYHPHLSQVALHQGIVCGIALARINHEQKLVIDARVIAPHARRSWVNPLMLEAMGLLAERLGLSTVRFTGNTSHHDTHRIASRFDSSFVRVMDLLIRVREPTDSWVDDAQQINHPSTLCLSGDILNAKEKAQAPVSVQTS